MKIKLFLIYLLLFILLYIYITNGYPYYSAWDSSLIYAIDSLIAGSNQPPDHFFHPNSIPLIFNKYITLPLGKLINIISVTSITELSILSNPYLSFIEVVNYLINLGYLYIIIFLITSYFIFSNLVKSISTKAEISNNFIFSISLIFLSLTWANLPYFLFWIRYESIGLVFWALALLFVIKAAQNPNALILFLLSGFFSGFAILSKIQFLGGTFALPFIFCTISTFPKIIVTRFQKFGLVIISFVTFIFISVIHYFSFSAFLQDRLLKAAFWTYLKKTDFIPFFPILTLLYLTFTIYIVFKKSSVTIFSLPYLYRLSIFIFGIFSPLIFSFLLGSTLHERSGSVFLTYIYSFMLGQRSMGAETGYIKSPDPFSFLILLIPFLIFVIIYFVPSYKKVFLNNCKNYVSVIFTLLSILVLLLASVVMLRDDLAKDGMIKDFWLVIAFLLIVRLLFLFLTLNKALVLFLILTWTIISYQSLQLFNYRKFNYIYTSNQSDYYYNLPIWKSFSYGFRGEQYKNLMQKAYPNDESWQLALRWSAHLSDLRLLLSQVFQKYNFNYKNSSLAIKNSLLSNDYIIHSISPELSGSIMFQLETDHISFTPRNDYEFYLISKLDNLSTSNSSLTELIFITNFSDNKDTYFVYKLGPGSVDLNMPTNLFWIMIKNKYIF